MYSVKVAQKIFKIMGMVEYLKKDGKVEFGSTKYKYLSEEKITQQIREKLLEVGLIIVPTKCKVMELPNQCEAVEMEYAIIDTDTGESIEVSIAGKGQDKGDKSMYKALTGAYKYMQRQTFAIPTGDDPDKISSDEMEEELRKMQEEQEKALQEAIDEAEKDGGKSSTVEKGTGTGKSQPSSSGKKPLTEVQKVHIMAQKRGKTEAMKDYVKKTYNKESMNDLTPEQLKAVKAVLEKYPELPKEDTNNG
jgi:hypothetical protein